MTLLELLRAAKNGYCKELVTRLKDKKNRAHKRAKILSNESTKSNLRATNYFFNTVNATMQNYEISVKKEFCILTKLMKSQKKKTSTIPPIIHDSTVKNDPKTKRDLFNDLFVAKSSLSGSNDPVPILPPNERVSSSLISINTSPIEVSKVLGQLKKPSISHCGI